MGRKPPRPAALVQAFVANAHGEEVQVSARLAREPALAPSALENTTRPVSREHVQILDKSCYLGYNEVLIQARKSGS